MDEECDGWGWLIGPGPLTQTYGAGVVSRALALAKADNLPPEGNIIPYINRVLDEARTAVSAEAEHGK